MSTQDNRPWKSALQPPYHGKRVEVMAVTSEGRTWQRQGFYDPKRDQWFASKTAQLQNRYLIVKAGRELPPR